MKRRELLSAAGALSLASLNGAQAAPAATPVTKTFRWAFVAGETGFDPAQINDLYSNYIVQAIIEPPLQYDYLARPTQLRPRTAAAMPEVSSDFKTFTVRIQPGIMFQDDPAFKGKPRELIAGDYVYAVKRISDPRWKSPRWPTIESNQIIGLDELRKEARAGSRFDYDRPIEGLRVVDRYTFEVKLARSSPRFLEHMADAREFGAVAREVVEAYPNEMMAHPVGTGPFRLVSWARASRIIMERNPGFREEIYDAEPPANDAYSQKILSRLKGRKLPMIDRVEISIIEESQPRWLTFLKGDLDAVAVPLEFTNIAAPNSKLAPSLARRGIVLDQTLNPDIVATMFNMNDPIVGGNAPEKIALRRAISLGYNLQEEIALIRRGTLMPAQSHVPPQTSGYDPAFRSNMSSFDRPQARALLDTFGYIDRDGDGWREMPDGSPLEIVMATQGSQIDRAFNEVWKRQLDRIGIRLRFQVNQWPENFKAVKSGKVMCWSFGDSASAEDSDDFLAFGFGPSKFAQNLACFDLPAYDKLYEKQRQLPNGAERDAVIREMKRVFCAYMPYKVHGHRIINDLAHPWLIGYRRHPFARDFFKFIDIDSERAQQLRA